MPLATNLADLATRLGTEFKTTKTLIAGNSGGDLSGLDTTDKSSLLAAINEVAGAVAGSSGIDDGTTGTTTTWSSSKITSYVGDEIAAIDIPDPADLINDTTASTSTVYSSTKTDGQISAAITALVNGAPTALDTLKELADAIASDETQIGSILTALDNRVRVDTAAQGLTTTQQGNARTNIAAASAAALTSLTTAVGDTEQDLVAVFEAGL